jgi:hypothetical protein
MFCFEVNFTTYLHPPKKLFIMKNKKTWTLSFCLILFALLNLSCKNKTTVTESFLKEESSIVEKYLNQIKENKRALSEAERTNNLQNQLDLKRMQDKLILEMNSAFRQCSEKYPSGRKIFFKERQKDGDYKVLEVKLIDCSLNQATLDIEILLWAKILIENSRSTCFTARLINNLHDELAQIKFHLTDDFSEPNKVVMVVSHPNNFQSIKNFMAIEFE